MEFVQLMNRIYLNVDYVVSMLITIIAISLSSLGHTETLHNDLSHHNNQLKKGNIPIQLSSWCCNEFKVKQASQEGTTTERNYKALRYDEDYRFLKDKRNHTDYLDPIKYIALRNDRDWYLTIGGEMRQRYEFFHNEDYGKALADKNGNNHSFLQRYMLHGDLHLGSNIRIFTQFMSTLEHGRIDGPRPEVDRNDFDMHQSFIDITKPLGDKNAVTLRLGRQEMEYGSGRLISGREAPNNRRSFDAVRILFKVDEWKIDTFLASPVRNLPGVFDDEYNHNKSIWGIYGTTPWKVLPDMHVDLYYLGYTNKHAVFHQGTGNELRHTMGSRFWGNPLPWKYNLELIGQFGRFGNGDIRAWAATSDTHYVFSGLPWKPQIGLRADITSGDNGGSKNLGTYNPLFPTGAYFNLADLGGPSNFMHLHPVITLSPAEKLKAIFDWGFFWRQNTNDAIYSITTTPLEFSETSKSRYSGSSPAVVLVWEPVNHVTILASYVHYFPSGFMKKRESAGKAVDYFTMWLTYKF